MYRISFIFSVLSISSGSLFGQGVGVSLDQAQYVERFKDIAIQEMERSGVPASIKLAQGILESDAGRSYLARNANNHFGIKCGNNWDGKEVFREDDDFDDKGRIIKSCFRGYRNAEASYVAHSEFLRDPAKAFRYGFLFRLDPLDYHGWAEGLRRAGYATNPRYPDLLISLIERYQLYNYDRPQAGSTINNPIDIETPAAELVAGIMRSNDVTYFISDKPLRVEEVARRVDLSVRRLVDYNEYIASADQEIQPGQRVFVQPKRNGYRGKVMYHTVLAGETLQDIADRYAIKVDKLLKRNRLATAAQLVRPGEKIKLKGGKVKEAPLLGGAPVVDPTNKPSIPTTPDGNLDMDTSNPLPPSNPPPPVSTQPGTVVIPPRPTIPNSQPPITNDQPGFGNGGSAPPTTNVPTAPPSTSPAPIPAPTPPSTPPPLVSERFHSVVSGDTLFNISRRYGLTVDQLKALNNLNSNLISIGQRLKVE